MLAAAAGLMAAFYVADTLSQPSPSSLAFASLSLLFIPFCLVWRTQPIISATGFIALLALWSAVWISQLPTNSGLTPWALTAPLAVYATSRYVERREIPRAVVAIAALGSFISPFLWRIDTESFSLHYELDQRYAAMLVAHWAVLGSTYFIAARYFDQDRQRVILARERFHQAQEEERLLIARELHDVLAHSLTLIKVQANAGLVSAQADPQAAREALSSIRDGADSALTEVRGIVTALRTTGPSELHPAQQLEHIEGIIDGFRAAGLHIDAQLPRDYTIASLLQLALVRIITEGLTNALRHQGPDTHVAVALTLDDDATLILTSTNPNPIPKQFPSSGVGLVGVAERTRALGGTLDYDGDATRFSLRARLPLGGNKRD